MSNLENADLAGIRTVLRGPLSPLARPAPASSAVPATGTASGAEGGVHASAAQGEPYTLKTAKGNESATLVHVSVPEIHANPAGPHVTLAVVKWSARERPTRPPVLYLAGGPGQSGIADARVEETFDLLERAREASDVLLLDQRGTGLSTPRLVCPSSGPLPSDFFLSAESMARALEPRVTACRDTWRGRGVHLDAYTTAESAEDIADVARQLGGGRVSLLGFSYGTHLATAVVRQHPEVVDRVVFAGYEGPDDTVKLPWTFDAQVAHISALAARQPEVAAAMPDFRAALLRVLTRAAAQPFEVHAGAETLRIGRDGLLYLLRRDIGDTNDLPQFPRLIAQLEVGDTTLLAGYAARRFRQLGSGVSLMGLAMDCSSGASAPRAAEVREQEPSSIFGAMTNPLSDGACEILGLHAAPGAHYTPLVSPVPALFVSGTLDSNTPPYQAERARWGLFNASHLIVRDAGHESTLVPAVRDAIVRFLRGEAVDDAVVTGPALTYAR
jgi:pimeloyl-ACP methyl ester carboxylesterase